MINKRVIGILLVGLLLFSSCGGPLEISKSDSESGIDESTLMISSEETEMEESSEQPEDSSYEQSDDGVSSGIVQKTYYECKLEYFINPIKAKEEPSYNNQYDIYGTYGRHVLDNIVKLLSSDSFTEVLTEGLEGVPVRLDQNDSITVEYSEFRKTELYIELMKKIKDSVVFSYKTFEENATLAYSSVWVDLSVKEDEAFAEILLSNIKREVPVYIEANMPVPNGYVGTRCQLLTENSELSELKKWEFELFKNMKKQK